MSLCAWFPLIGTLDNQGTDNVSFTTTNASFQNDGKLGKCLKLGYSSDFTIPSLVKSKQISIAYWLRVNTATSTQWLDPIHYYTNPEGGTGAGWVTRQELYSNCTTTGFWFDNGSIVSIPITVGQWAHFAITVDYEAGVAKVYKDGVLQGTSTSVTKTTQITGNNFRIGENGLDLSENDVRIYNHILSPKEIEILARGLVLHYPLCDPYIEDTTNIMTIQTASAANIGGWGGHSTQRTIVDATNYPIPCNTCNKLAVTYSGSGSGGSGMSLQRINCSPSTTYTYSCYLKTPDALGPLNANILYRYEYKSDGAKATEAGCWGSTSNVQTLSDGWYRIWGTFTVTANTTYFDVYNFVYPNKTCDYYIGCWQLELKSHVTPYVFGSRADRTVYDCSGNRYNSTMNSSTTLSDASARYPKCTYFGSYGAPCTNSDYAQLFPALSNCSVSWWEYCKTTGNTLIFTGQATNKYIAAGSSSTALYHEGIGSGYKLYKDGVQVSSAYHTQNQWHHFVLTGINLTSWTEFHINKYSSGWPTNSYMSDVRIYSTALSASAVAELYNTSASISNNGTLMAYEFVES